MDLRPNASTRDWMDKTGESFAYRCPPLNIANAYGWSFHVMHDFTVNWDGQNLVEALTIHSDAPNKNGKNHITVVNAQTGPTGPKTTSSSYV